MKSSVSIALFFLLSGFFLFALLAALQHSGKALAIAGACLAAVVCIIVFLTPVRLPDLLHRNGTTSTSGAATSGAATTVLGPSGATSGSTSTTLGGTATSGAAR